MLAKAIWYWGFAVLAACGGSTTTIGAGDAGGGDDATGQDSATDGPGAADGPTTDAPATDAPTLGDSSLSCDQLLAQVDALRQAAIACCPTCNIAQCTQTAPDVCCAISVDNAGSQAVVAFENAVTVYKAKCPSACPGIPCKVVPSLMCDGKTSKCL